MKTCQRCKIQTEKRTGDYLYKYDRDWNGFKKKILIEDITYCYCKKCGWIEKPSPTEENSDTTDRLTPTEIKQIRKYLKLKINEMADFLNIERRTYYKIESGASKPSKLINILLKKLRPNCVDFVCESV